MSPNGGSFFESDPPPVPSNVFKGPTFRKAFIVNGRIFVTRSYSTEEKLFKSNKLLAPSVATVSAANYQYTSLASEGIASIFGTGLTLTTATASVVPIPTNLENTSVTITDSNGASKLAPLFYVSPTQINLQIPAGLSAQLL